MNKLSVYLDTTIPSYLFEEREELQTFVQITRQWWELERQHFDLYISEEILTELKQGNYPNKAKVLSSLSETIMLPEDQRVNDQVKVYIDNYLMPKSVKGDAAHLAYASFYHLDFLLTWNCHHLANANKKRHLQVIHSRLGLYLPEIVTPLQLFKGEIYDT
jgi:predicted nucleic acid-binding protein